jgi:hypothetical protein
MLCYAMLATDWSIDGRLLQSNCGAYEILYWDAVSGRQFLFRKGENASNTKWKTETCVLGFSVSKHSIA